MSVLVAQLGARMRYAVPRIFHQEGQLDRLFTDICAVKGWPQLLGLVPPSVRSDGIQRLMTRRPDGIPPSQITAFTDFGLTYARRIAAARSADERNAVFLWGGSEFCRRVIDAGLGAAKSVYVYNSAGLELLRESRRRGLPGIMEQTIAPRAIEWKLLQEEQSLFPNWEAPLEEGLIAEYSARESAEWAESSVIACGSDFVREGIIACGGPADRCAVIPYGLERPRLEPEKKPRAAGPLRVLTVGAVGLRKGSPYVLATARKLAGRAHFRMVGAIHLLPQATEEIRQHVEIIGSVPASEIKAHFDWADVFLLPSVCEGSATATYEALFAGRPVICTPQTGSVVRDGVDGHIVALRDSEAITEHLLRLANDPKILTAMSENAFQRSREYTLEKYGGRLMTCLRERGVLA